MNVANLRFSDLLHVDAVVPFLDGQSDADCFHQLAAVFESFGLIDTLHVTLLHYHFNLSTDEDWIETVVGTRQIVSPAYRDESVVFTAAQPSSWRICNIEGQFRLIPLQFGPPRFPDASRYLTESAVSAIGNVLSTFNVLNRFGIGWPADLPCHADEVLVEYPRVADRSLITGPETRAILNMQQALGTSWCLRPFVTPVAWCKRESGRQVCKGYCSTACIVSNRDGTHSGSSAHESRHDEGYVEPEKTYHYE